MSKSKFPGHLKFAEGAARETDTNGNEHVWVPMGSEPPNWLRMGIQSEAGITQPNEDVSALAVRIQEFRELRWTRMQKLFKKPPDDVIDAPVGPEGAKIPLVPEGKSRKAFLVWARQNGLRLDSEAITQLFQNIIEQRELLGAWLVQINESQEEFLFRNPRKKLPLTGDLIWNTTESVQATTQPRTKVQTSEGKEDFRNENIKRVISLQKSVHETSNDNDSMEKTRIKLWIQTSILPLLDFFGRTEKINSSNQIPIDLKNILEMQSGTAHLNLTTFIRLLEKINRSFVHQFGYHVSYKTTCNNNSDQNDLWGGTLIVDTHISSHKICLEGKEIHIDILGPNLNGNCEAGCVLPSGSVFLYKKHQDILTVQPLAEKLIRLNMPRVSQSPPAMADVLLGQQLQHLSKKYSPLDSARAVQRCTLSHELRHLFLHIVKNLDDNSSLEQAHAAIGQLISSENSQTGKLWRSGTNLNNLSHDLIQFFHDNVIEELHTYMTECAEEPVYGFLQLMQGSLNVVNGRDVIYFCVAQCLTILIAQMLDIQTPIGLTQAWKLQIHDNGLTELHHVHECWNLIQEIILRPEAELRLAIKSVYEREFNTSIDSPPFAKIGSNGELLSRLQVPDELLD